MKKFLGLLIAVAATFAAVGVGTGAAAGTCTGPLNESIAKTPTPGTITGATPFAAGTATVNGGAGIATAATTATVVFSDGSGNTLTVVATGTTSGVQNRTFTITGGTISGTGACAGATGSVTGGVIRGENGNTNWVTTSAITGTFSIPTAAAPAPVVVRGPDRYGYCLNGVFLNLLLGQPDYDPLYKGATPAFYVDGIGITCDPPSGVFSLAVDKVGPDGQPAPPGYNFPSVIYPHYVHQ